MDFKVGMGSFIRVIKPAVQEDFVDLQGMNQGEY